MPTKRNTASQQQEEEPKRKGRTSASGRNIPVASDEPEEVKRRGPGGRRSRPQAAETEESKLFKPTLKAGIFVSRVFPIQWNAKDDSWSYGAAGSMRTQHVESDDGQADVYEQVIMNFNSKFCPAMLTTDDEDEFVPAIFEGDLIEIEGKAHCTIKVVFKDGNDAEYINYVPGDDFPEPEKDLSFHHMEVVHTVYVQMWRIIKPGE